MSVNLSFKTNIQLKSIIGKDLINDDNIAVLELVKNAFDADSKKVSISYLNLKNNDDNIVDGYSNKTTRLIIRDDGLGMDLDDIQNKWLNIAYSEKKSNKIQHKRMMAGAKGVGRFSCDRLGQYLNLYAKKINSSEYIKLKINWNLFEIEDKDKEIQSIPIEYETLSKVDLMNHNIEPFEKNQGICLEIIKLRSNWVTENRNKNGEIVDWNTEKLINLKKYLEKLINPSQAFERENDFGIFLNAPEFIDKNNILPENEKFIGKVENRIFEKLDFKTTSIECRTIDDGRLIYTELKDRGESIFWIKEKNPYSQHVKNAKLSFYYLNPYSKAFFTKQTGISSISYGSIFLFINGFRVPPYGETDNDWLNLNQRKTQGSNRFLGVREIVGNVEILDEENDFQIISSREGIVRNDNYFQLTNPRGNNSFIFKAFRRLERYVVEGIDWDSLPKGIEDTYNQIEKKILSGELTEDNLVYKEDDNTKRLRIYSTIHSIISARPEDVEELYINENLILNKIEEERKKSEQEFEQLLIAFEEKRIDPDSLNRILQKKAEQNSELEKQLKEFSKYETSPATTKAIIELQLYKRTIEKQALVIRDLQAKLEALSKEKEQSQKEKELLKKNNAEIEKRARQAEQELDIEKEKNRYLLATRVLTDDEESFNHLINNYSQEAETSLVNISRIIKEKDIPVELLEALDSLKLYVNKIKKLTSLLNKADIKTLSESHVLEIPKFIRDYVSDFANVTNKIELDFESNEVSFVRNISMLDISMILDNLIINSTKAGAKKVNIKCSTGNLPNEYFIDFSDDGEGVLEPLYSNPEAMFEVGITTRSGGSGIGLSTVRRMMKNNLFGDIVFLDNNLVYKGATFRLIF